MNSSCDIEDCPETFLINRSFNALWKSFNSISLTFFIVVTIGHLGKDKGFIGEPVKIANAPVASLRFYAGH